MQIFGKFPGYFEEKVGLLGFKVATYPKWSMTVSILLAAIFGLGFTTQFRFLNDLEVLFVPRASQGMEERKIVESFFAPSYAWDYVKGHETQYLSQVSLIIATKNPSQDSLKWHNGLLEFGAKIDEALNKLEVESQLFGNVTLSDVCARSRKDGDCDKNEILELLSVGKIINEIRKKDINLTFPLFKNVYKNNKEIFLPFYLGNLTFDQDKFEDASILKLVYVLDEKSSFLKRKTAKIWERAAMKFIQESDWKDDRYQLLAHSSESLGKELCENVHEAFATLPLAIALVAGFVFFNGLTMNSAYCATLGIFNTLLGIFSGWGLTAWCGQYSWQAVNLAGIVLLLGVGIDDTFVMLSAWQRQRDREDTLEDKMRDTYKEAAVSITITTATNVCSFVIGIMIPAFKSVSSFCAYTSAGLFFIYLWTLTFFGPFIALNYEFNQKTIEFFQDQKEKLKKGMIKVVKKMSENWAEKIAKRMNEDRTDFGFYEWFFARFLANSLMKKWVQILILISWLSLTGFCAYKISEIKEGFESIRITRTNSKMANYLEIENEFFRKLNYRIHAVITDENLDFTNQTVTEEVLKLVQNVYDLPLMSENRNLSENWLQAFLDFIEDRELAFPVNSNEFNHEVKRFFRLFKKTPLPLNVKFGPNDTILANRFMFQTEDIKDAKMEIELVKSLRKIATESKLKVTFFHPLFPFFDQFIQIWENTRMCILTSGICVLLVTILFLPNLKAAPLLVINCATIMIQVIGFMVLWQVYLDIISMITIIMCIGFSVDFCAHICHHFYHSHCETPGEKLSESLLAFGPPILQGGISTLLAVIPLCTLPSYVLLVFVKTVVLVITLGVAHGLLILPVLMISIENLIILYYKLTIFKRVS